MMSDIEIALKATMKPITQVASNIGIEADELELYGKYKAKIADCVFEHTKNNPDGKLILVTAINPTPAGEGKTTTTIGLGQGLEKIGKKAIIALREPSLGPVFGVKGGAAGGGYSQVVPMEDINLHFTGDMHAITSANNLLCAAMDNHIHHGNELKIDTRQILFKRCLDMNDRALRDIVVGNGGKMNGFVRQDSFQITVASEVMAILCLASDVSDLKTKLGNILVAYTVDGNPVFAKELRVEGSMAVLLKDAIKPNLVQTLENTPALMHGGPFANIAHGCNSIRATKLALKLADYTVTEAGFGSDLGAEKFLDIKCRIADLKPATIVLVATIRALKYNGGMEKTQLTQENVSALEKGLVNLQAHVENMNAYGVPVVVAINAFHTDTQAEKTLLANACEKMGVSYAFSNAFAQGGEGAMELAHKVVESCEKPANFKPIYDTACSIKDKVHTICTKIYGAQGVDYATGAEKSIAQIEALNMANLPVCIAKTQYSLSDNPALLGRPTGFRMNVKEIKLSAGAGFIVVLTGDVMTMPGLPKKPAAMVIDINENNVISGLF